MITSENYSLILSKDDIQVFPWFALHSILAVLWLGSLHQYFDYSSDFLHMSCPCPLELVPFSPGLLLSHLPCFHLHHMSILQLGCPLCQRTTIHVRLLFLSTFDHCLKCD